MKGTRSRLLRFTVAVSSARILLGTCTQGEIFQPHDAKLISLIDDDKDRTVSQNAETESKKVCCILLLSHDSRNDGWMEKATLKEIPIGVQRTDIPVQKHHLFYYRMHT